ncbi:hypothetical protein HAX54_012751, partial [Datura stramonium]|nr:hypothetical protein [Datura stramonium]
MGLRFVFANPGECNLTLVREFYANWDVHIEPNERKDDNSHKTLDMTYFTMEAWVWMRVICAWIMPFDHLTKVKRDKYPLNENAQYISEVGPIFEEPLDDYALTSKLSVHEDKDEDDEVEPEHDSKDGDFDFALTDEDSDEKIE